MPRHSLRCKSNSFVVVYYLSSDILTGLSEPAALIIPWDLCRNHCGPISKNIIHDFTIFVNREFSPFFDIIEIVKRVFLMSLLTNTAVGCRIMVKFF